MIEYKMQRNEGDNMKVLHNRISNKELQEKAKLNTQERTTISFYKYFNIEDPQSFRDDLYVKFVSLDVFGRVYVASEGINAQISLPTSNLELFKDLLYNYTPEFNGLRLNLAIEDKNDAFFVLRMKVRNKIVADGIEDESFDPSNTGQYLKAKQVNDMIEQEDTIFVDMRNHYEYEIGHFKNAIEIPSDTFKEQLPMALDMLEDHKDKNIVMYCTGGIRCEKATAYMKHNGFDNIYHVEGGIIEYARQAKNEGLDSQFIGKNFVFDERLGERITDDVIASCHTCGKPCDSHTNCANQACHTLFIQCEECRVTYENCCSEACVETSKLPEEAIKELARQKTNNNLTFKKGLRAKA